MFAFIFLLGHNILGTELMAGLCIMLKADLEIFHSLIGIKRTDTGMEG